MINYWKSPGSSKYSRNMIVNMIANTIDVLAELLRINLSSRNQSEIREAISLSNA